MMVEVKIGKFIFAPTLVPPLDAPGGVSIVKIHPDSESTLLKIPHLIAHTVLKVKNREVNHPEKVKNFGALRAPISSNNPPLKFMTQPPMDFIFQLNFYCKMKVLFKRQKFKLNNFGVPANLGALINIASIKIVVSLAKCQINDWAILASNPQESRQNGDCRIKT